MNSKYSVDLHDSGRTQQTTVTSSWCESYEQQPGIPLYLFRMVQVAGLAVVSLVTAISEPWLIERKRRDAVVTIHTAVNRMLISDLGWSREQALETRMRLRTFEEDWDAPGMEDYDEL